MRVIFDTNFWSYLAESNFENQFLEIENFFDLKIILPPSILLEVQKTKDREKRIKTIKAMAKPWRYKSRTEVDLESDEFVKALIMHHPILRRHHSNKCKVNEIRKFWVKRLWETAVTETDRFHKVMSVSDVGKVKAILADQEEKKELYRSAKWDFNKARPSSLKVSLPSGGASSYSHLRACEEYEPWRIFNFEYYKQQLKYHVLPNGHDDRTVADWCEPLIKIRKLLDQEGVHRDFWLEKAEIKSMPRNWLRWAVGALQPFKKISAGNPQDEQHAAYLVDAHIFFTCDKRYYQILKTILDDNVVSIARPILLEADINLAFNTIRKTLTGLPRLS